MKAALVIALLLTGCALNKTTPKRSYYFAFLNLNVQPTEVKINEPKTTIYRRKRA